MLLTKILYSFLIFGFLLLDQFLPRRSSFIQKSFCRIKIPHEKGHVTSALILRSERKKQVQKGNI